MKPISVDCSVQICLPFSETNREIQSKKSKKERPIEYYGNCARYSYYSIAIGNSTGKCRTCSEGKCERKYKNRKRCDDPNNCTCTCQEEAIETFAKGFSSIGYGMCAVTVSVVFTLATAGAGLGAVATIAALSGCSALTGVGSAMIIHPVAKKMSGERITGGNYIKDVAIGGTIGAVTGPIGLGGASATASIASKVGTEVGKQGAVKFGCRTVVGAVSGATASAIQEVAEATSRKVSGEKVFANQVQFDQYWERRCIGRCHWMSRSSQRQRR